MYVHTRRTNRYYRFVEFTSRYTEALETLNGNALMFGCSREDGARVGTRGKAVETRRAFDKGTGSVFLQLRRSFPFFFFFFLFSFRDLWTSKALPLKGAATQRLSSLSLYLGIDHRERIRRDRLSRIQPAFDSPNSSISSQYMYMFVFFFLSLSLFSLLF